MENLWSPWRSKYIEGFKEEHTKTGCFLCDAADSDVFNDNNLLVHRSDLSIVLMNRYPYNSGHLLIAPKQHIGDFTMLNDDLILDINMLIKCAVKILTLLYKPHGFNIGANLGRAAGAGVPEHIHYHIVPRWNGDTNFMPVLGEIKVISESLEDARNRISEQFRIQG